MHNLQNTVLKHNDDKKRVEREVEKYVDFIEYKQNKDKNIFLTQTEVPTELEGKGVGSAIVSRTLEWIKNQGYTLAPLCPFVAAYLKRHPEWAAILAPGFHV